MRQSTAWSGTYRGINFKIVNHSVHKFDAPLGIWNYYIFLHKSRFVDQKKTGLFFLKIAKNNTAIPLDMHGGITYYEYIPITHNDKGWVKNIIKIGCDYNQRYDEGRFYNEDRLQVDVMECIDKFRNAFEYLVWCDTDKKLRLEKKVKYNTEKSMVIK